MERGTWQGAASHDRIGGFVARMTTYRRDHLLYYGIEAIYETSTWQQDGNTDELSLEEWGERMFDQKDEAKAKEFAKRQDKNVRNRATGTAAGRKAAEARYKMEDAARMAVSGGQGGGKGKWILVALAAVLFLGVVGLVISRVADRPSAVTATAPAAGAVSTETAAVDTTEADEATTVTDTVEAADETEVLEAAAAILESGEILDLTEDELLWPIALEDAEIQRKSIGGPEVHSNDYGLL